MALPSVFALEVTNGIISRIHKLQPGTTPLWGKMDAAQMLAHCCVSYEMIYDDIHPRPNFLMKFILKAFVKKGVVNEVPYKHNLQTAPAFIIKSDKNFETEKARLIAYLQKTQQLGEAFFTNRESHSFGILTKDEWNNMLYKHIDHHLKQFSV